MTKLPEALYSAAQMRELDRCAIVEHGIPAATLMTRAGVAAWEMLKTRWPNARQIVIFAGVGNNAGDGYVLAAQAQRAKRGVLIVNVGDAAKFVGAAAEARKRYLSAKGKEQPFDGSLPDDADLLVDAMFGIGLTRPLAGQWAEAVTAINASGKPVFAVDIPSGLSADTGAVLGSAVHATATATFIGMKAGLFTGEGPACTGPVELATLEVPGHVYTGVEPVARLIGDDVGRLPPRARSAHKGNFGHVLVIGGNHGMGGAVRLTAEAALRTGAGLVSVVTRPTHVAGFLAGLPETMVHGVDDPAEVTEWLERATVVAVGPGLGQDDWGRILFARALDTPLPVVVDADALNLLAAHPLTRGQWILTPHPGEAARLLQQSVAEIQRDRLRAAGRIAERYRAEVVLKGAGSIAVSENRAPEICRYGNPGMAAPGMGDVLTGIIAALVAQGLSLPEAVRTGVQVHARAGDLAAEAGERGLMAGDLIRALRQTVNV